MSVRHWGERRRKRLKLTHPSLSAAQNEGAHGDGVVVTDGVCAVGHDSGRGGGGELNPSGPNFYLGERSFEFPWDATQQSLWPSSLVFINCSKFSIT